MPTLFRYSLCLKVLVIFALSPGLGRAQNLLTNGSFDTNVSGWTYPDATPIWTTLDVDGAATSGSAFGTNSASAAGARTIVLQQCVPVTKPGVYVFSVSAFTPTGQVAGDLLGSYSLIVAAGCSGGSINEGGFFLPSVGQWQTFSSGSAIKVSSPLPAPFSLLISLGIDKTPAGGSFKGHFDDVTVISDTVFTNGFQ